MTVMHVRVVSAGQTVRMFLDVLQKFAVEVPLDRREVSRILFARLILQTTLQSHVAVPRFAERKFGVDHDPNSRFLFDRDRSDVDGVRPAELVLRRARVQTFERLLRVQPQHRSVRFVRPLVRALISLEQNSVPEPADLNSGRRICGEAADEADRLAVNRVDHLDSRQPFDFRLVLDVDGGVSLQMDRFLFVQNFVRRKTRQASKLSSSLEGEPVGRSESDAVFFSSYFFVSVILKTTFFSSLIEHSGQT